MKRGAFFVMLITLALLMPQGVRGQQAIGIPYSPLSPKKGGEQLQNPIPKGVTYSSEGEVERFKDTVENLRRIAKIVITSHSAKITKSYRCKDMKSSGTCSLGNGGVSYIEDQLTANNVAWTDRSDSSSAEEHTHRNLVVTVPRYGSKRCETILYYNELIKKGFWQGTCGDGEKHEFNYPPQLVNAESLSFPLQAIGGGSRTELWNGSVDTEDTRENVPIEGYSIQQDSTTHLVVEGDPAKTYNVTLFAKVTRSRVLRAPEYDREAGQSVPCSQIKILNRSLRPSCILVLPVKGWTRVDVTPSVNDPYYTYNVTAQYLEEADSRYATPVRGEGVTPHVGNTAEIVGMLRVRVQELAAQRDELRTKRDAILRERSAPFTPPPPSPSPRLNAAPIRKQLGDITESLRGILENLNIVISN
jgi:hypothetical protein